MTTLIGYMRGEGDLSVASHAGETHGTYRMEYSATDGINSAMPNIVLRGFRAMRMR
jgi:hypothetical protein